MATTGNSAMWTGDPPDGFKWQKDPNSWPTFAPYPTYPGTAAPSTQPAWTPPPITRMDLEQILKQLEADNDAKKKTIEERLDSIEQSLTVILELMGTVLAARGQQLTKETEIGTKVEGLGEAPNKEV